MTLFRKVLPAFFLLMLFAACGKHKDVPATSDIISADSLIPQDKMVLILSDVHMAEAGFMLERNTGAKQKDVAGFYQGIYKKYRITAGMYDQSVKYYRQKPEVYVKIYEKVVTVLESRQSQLAGKK
jgi:hypothetical protein